MSGTRGSSSIDTDSARQRNDELLAAVASGPSRSHPQVRFRPRGPRSKQRALQTGHLGADAIRLVVMVCAVVAVAALGWTLSIVHSGSAAGQARSTIADHATTTHKAKKVKHHKTTAPRATASGAPKRISHIRVAAASASAQQHPTKRATAAKQPSDAKMTPARRSVASLSRGDIVVIDAGHQGRGDSSLEPIGPGSSQKKPKVAGGASGQYAPHAEGQINLDVALRLQRVLAAKGVKVVMVRTTQNVNISNSRRAAIANGAHAALFIRLHCDGASSSSRHGLSTLVPAKNHWTGPIVSASAKAGFMVHRAALAATDAADNGVVNRGDLSGFNWSRVPTVLVEMGFMSNRAEDRALTTAAYQQKLAVGLANGVMHYLKSR